MEVAQLNLHGLVGNDCQQDGAGSVEFQPERNDYLFDYVGCLSFVSVPVQVLSLGPFRASCVMYLVPVSASSDCVPGCAGWLSIGQLVCSCVSSFDVWAGW